MTNKKSTFTVLTTSIALVGLTTLMTTASLIPASQVQSRPLSQPRVDTPVNTTPIVPASRVPGQSPVYTPKTPQHLSTIQGKLNSNDPSSNQVACSQITVELNESIPTQQTGIGTNPTINQLSQVIATGSNLASGCTYTIAYGGDGKPVKNAYGYSSFIINAARPGIDTYSSTWSGGKGFNEVPSVADLSMVHSSGPN